MIKLGLLALSTPMHDLRRRKQMLPRLRATLERLDANSAYTPLVPTPAPRKGMAGFQHMNEKPAPTARTGGARESHQPDESDEWVNEDADADDVGRAPEPQRWRQHRPRRGGRHQRH
jgi:hypothetical protein